MHNNCDYLALQSNLQQKNCTNFTHFVQHTLVIDYQAVMMATLLALQV